MIKRLLIALVCVSLSPGRALAEPMSQVTVNGVTVRVYGTPEEGFVVIANGPVVLTDEHTSRVGIDSIHEGDGRTYIIVSEYSGGASCCYSFRAVDMSNTDYKVSPEFELDGRSTDIKVAGGALHIDTLSSDQKLKLTYIFMNGQFKREERVNSLEATGPDRAPGGDMAAFANGKKMSDLFKARATARPLQKLLGTYFDEARGIALADFGGALEERHRYVVGRNAQPHNAQHALSIAFDHEGQVWALLVLDDSTHSKVYFGDPDAEVRRLLGL